MPNWKKVIVSGSDASLNSLIVKNNTTISGSLYISGTQQAGGNNNLLTWNPTTGLVTYSTGSIVLTGSISGVDYIDFNTAANPTHLEGRIHWDSGTKTIQIDTDSPNFAIDAGHQSVVRVYNDTGFDINSGSLVYINGAQGNTPTITTASWDIDPTSAGTIGFAATLIPGTGGNRHGYVVTSGLLTNINTNGFAVGTRLYLSSSGQFTDTAPDAPLHEVRVGVVIVNNATTGVIYVNVVNGFELTELHDVRTTTESNGDLLMYSSSLWINTKQLTGSYGLTGSLTATSFTGSLSGTASYANNTDLLDGIDSTRFATTGSNTFTANQVISGSLTVRDNLIVLGSASIQFISESQLNIGTNLITVNTFSPSIRFGGLAVIDSGSSGGSGSFLYDSVQDEFIFVHRGVPNQITSSHFILGPETYNNLGNETYLSQNRLPKGTGIEHLADSNITDTGTNVSINSNTQITGSLIVSGSNTFIGTQTVSGSISVSGSLEAAYKSPYTAKSALYTASIFDSTIEFTSGNVTCSLYTAAGNTGRQLYIKNDGTGVITVDAAGSETIDGQLTRALTQYEDLLIQADGTNNWIILNRKPATMIFSHTAFAPADATTYYFGATFSTPLSAESVTRQVIAPASGWIRTVSLCIAVGTPATQSGTSTFQIRNVTTSTTVNVVTNISHTGAGNQAQHVLHTLATPLHVKRGDFVTMLWNTPTWAGTNDLANVIHTAIAVIE